jgi:plasmid maintenance system antidote protein VapI
MARTSKTPSAELKALLKQYGLSEGDLAGAIGKGTAVITGIAGGTKKVDAETSLLLGKAFGLKDAHFLTLQVAVDIVETAKTAEVKKALSTIKKVRKATPAKAKASKPAGAKKPAAKKTAGAKAVRKPAGKSAASKPAGKRGRPAKATPGI